MRLIKFAFNSMVTVIVGVALLSALTQSTVCLTMSTFRPKGSVVSTHHITLKK